MMCLAAGLDPRDRVTRHLMELQWLPIRQRIYTQRISFKLCLMMHAVMTGPCLNYICDNITQMSTLPGRDRLCTAVAGQFDVPRTRTVFGERAFSVSGTQVELFPPDISNIDSEEAFKRDLKTYYFKQTYYCEIITDRFMIINPLSLLGFVRSAVLTWCT